MRRIELFKNALNEKRALKIISGINNLDLNRVRMVVSAAIEGGATAIDVSANKEVLAMASEMVKDTNITLFASSISSQELIDAVNLFHVDTIELGNFDALYKEGISMSSMEILNIVKETLASINKEEVLFSVTIPGNLAITDQILLARELELLNIDLIQTEGFVTEINNFEGARAWLNRAELTISNTLELARNIELPIMTASNINTTTASFAFAAGASAIGCGSCVNRLESEISMLAVIKNLTEIANRNSMRNIALV